MTSSTSTEQRLLKKIRQLPTEKIIEVEDFVDFLMQRGEERALAKAAAQMSEPVLQKIWDNPDDAEYDNLRPFHQFERQ
jgi:hypothetical protein